MSASHEMLIRAMSVAIHDSKEAGARVQAEAALTALFKTHAITPVDMLANLRKLCADHGILPGENVGRWLEAKLTHAVQMEEALKAIQRQDTYPMTALLGGEEVKVFAKGGFAVIAEKALESKP